VWIGCYVAVRPLHPSTSYSWHCTTRLHPYLMITICLFHLSRLADHIDKCASVALACPATPHFACTAAV
jgi:hypothetical protein